MKFLFLQSFRHCSNYCPCLAVFGELSGYCQLDDCNPSGPLLKANLIVIIFFVVLSQSISNLLFHAYRSFLTKLTCS